MPGLGGCYADGFQQQEEKAEGKITVGGTRGPRRLRTFGRNSDGRLNAVALDAPRGVQNTAEHTRNLLDATGCF